MALLPDTSLNDVGFTAAVKQEPNKTYKMLIEDEKIIGSVDDLAAIEQACYKIINTERYRYVIYSWNYGIELQDLFGTPIPYVFSELPRRITEALTQDDRVENVTNFELSHKKGNVLAKFEVVTKYGNIQMEKGVTIF